MPDLPWKKKDSPLPPAGSPPQNLQSQPQTPHGGQTQSPIQSSSDKPEIPTPTSLMPPEPMGPPPPPLVDQPFPEKEVEKQAEGASMPEPGAPPAPPSTPSDAPLLTQEPKKSKLPLIIGAIVVVNLIIWGFVGYTYFQNQKLKKQVKENEDSTVDQSVTLPTATSAPQYSIEIQNGNVSRVASSGESTVLVNKEDYEGTGITGFTNVETSPDKKRICFWSLPPALSPALYYSDIQGSAVTKVRDRVKDCKWSNNGNNIAYIDDTSLESASNIYVYYLLTKQETNLTSASTASDTYRRYTINSWLEDDNKITCNYEEISSATAGATTKTMCEINVTTGQVSDL